MASLISCPVCGGKLSSEALSCPHCGQHFLKGKDDLKYIVTIDNLPKTYSSLFSKKDYHIEIDSGLLWSGYHTDDLSGAHTLRLIEVCSDARGASLSISSDNWNWETTRRPLSYVTVDIPAAIIKPVKIVVSITQSKTINVRFES